MVAKNNLTAKERIVNVAKINPDNGWVCTKQIAGEAGIGFGDIIEVDGISATVIKVNVGRKKAIKVGYTTHNYGEAWDRLKNKGWDVE